MNLWIILPAYENYPLHILFHTINRGLGETERDAFEYVAAKANREDVAIRLDCEDTHDPQYIRALLDKIGQGFDVVNTSRFQKGGCQKGASAYRCLISNKKNIFTS